jgi:subtilisin family serine protease
MDSVQAAQDTFESSPPVDLDIQYRYLTIPAVLASVSANDLAALQDAPRVLAIVPNELMYPRMLEGNAMINQPAAIASGHDGIGSVVAVIDTGVDFNHVALMGARAAEFCFSRGLSFNGCPNGAAVQEGLGAAADDGTQDGGHGTAVASIIASRGGDGVAAGVAPGAKIVAHRVGSPFQSGFWSSDVLAALDHINSSQVGVINNVNMSLGSTTQHATVASCETAGGPTPAGSGRRAVTDSLFGTHGILVVASSGNFAQANAMSEPACLPSVMSVGAVVDVALSIMVPNLCSGSVLAGEVPCYSNAAPFLDVLAPSHCALTARAAVLGGGTLPCFGGTSASAPYVAGAAALLMGTSKALSAAQTWDKLVATGIPVDDPRTDYPDAPLINLLNAFEIELTITVGADKDHDTVQAALTAANPRATSSRSIPARTARTSSSPEGGPSSSRGWRRMSRVTPCYRAPVAPPRS